MTFDATLTLPPDLLAGTALAPTQDALDAVREAVERLSGAAWIDVEWADPHAAAMPLVRRLVVRGATDDAQEAALAAVIEMVARHALQICADRVAQRPAP